jgi:tetratricopeptide (TPR) repeat protein
VCLAAGTFRQGLIAVLCVATAVMLAGPAAADDRDTCFKESGDVAIAACTRAIVSGNYRGKDLSELYVARCAEYNGKGDSDRAIADCNESLRLNPQYALAFNNRGNAYKNKGQNDRAIQDYDQAIRLDPQYADAFYNRGIAYGDKGQYDRAIQDYDQAIRLNPQHANAFNNRGTAYGDKGQYDRAIQDYDQAIRLVPNSFQYLRNRGNAYFLAGNYDRAIADYDAVGRIDPKAADGLYGRGMAKLKKGDSAGGNADITAAKALEADIAEQFAKYGIRLNEAAASTAPLTATAATDCARAEAHWKSAEDIKTLAVYEDHLARFPNCDFAALAAARIEALKK